jgi:phosphoribosylglycinamide formyltransferase-1
LVVDAGYDRVHTQPFLDAFADRIINVHPSLLPEFAGGMDAVERALAGGAQVTGATVHIVTGELDAGPILIQEAVPIREGDTVESLRQRVHEAEHRILPQAIRLMEAQLAKSPAVG